MTFMKKFMDFLNLGNWENGKYIKPSKNIDMSCDTSVPTLPEADITKISEDDLEHIYSFYDSKPDTIAIKKISNQPVTAKQRKQKFSDKLSSSKQDFDVFLWQCNSIAETRDSEDKGYEYTNLDNPNDPLEVGYRNALLDLSDYTKLPLINFNQDKYAPGGYVPRKMIDWVHAFEKCENIFKGSSLPILCKLNYIIRNINTTILQNPDGTIGRTVDEYFYYEIPLKYQNEFLEMLDKMNDLLKTCKQDKYLITLANVRFNKTENPHVKYSLPLSRITYDAERHLFYYQFSNEVIPDKYSSTYKNTEYGSLVFTEDGVMKEATFTKTLDDKPAICKFKNYKSGFDLYDIRFNGFVIYRRNSVRTPS